MAASATGSGAKIAALLGYIAGNTNSDCKTRGERIATGYSVRQLVLGIIV